MTSAQDKLTSALQQAQDFRTMRSKGISSDVSESTGESTSENKSLSKYLDLENQFAKDNNIRADLARGSLVRSALSGRISADIGTGLPFVKIGASGSLEKSADSTATNDAYRFTPNGPSIVTVDWLKGASVIGTGNTVNVCPSTNPTTYTARATYLPCNGGTPVVVTSNVNVVLAGSLNSSITASQNVSCKGGNNGTATAQYQGEMVQ